NGAKEVDSAAMKTGRFAYDLGENFNQDTDNINQGYPELKWQGGSEPEVPEFEQNIASDMAALFMKDMDRAKELAAEKLLVDIEVEKAGGLDYYRQWFGEDLTMEEIYRRCGIDIDDDGTMSPDNENKYQLKKQAELLLPEEGEHGTEISWSSSDEDIIDPGTGMVSLPQSGKAEVKLTAAVSMGGYSGRGNSTSSYGHGSHKRPDAFEIKAKQKDGAYPAYADVRRSLKQPWNGIWKKWLRRHISGTP
ncbi:MAG: immunoglobulin-like domain-containing protein, partial [Anaerovoracaceae bacterium]